MSAVSTVVFDVNETLSDLGPLQDRFRDLGAPGHLAPLWFASVLRDGLALATTGHSAPFAEIGRTLLTSMLDPRSLDRPVDEAAQHVMDGFMSLSVHEDVPDGIAALRGEGLRLVTLTNGSSAVADQLLAGAGLREAFERLLTVEDAGLWKPAGSAYEFAAEQCGTDLADMVLVAVHPWDIHGAAIAGMRTAWINRSGHTYPGYFTAPDIEVAALPDLASRLP
ncbi:MAG TPA: haloacid dehalogenase type II [Ornithinimicrobium sp.]|uniref:haloacid dehalogenase type II n=1 Tax=Ornithinimicrobium sp. TaxID=1977084 RepID=UPI002B483212|nr:haloacid dehalogenase type II [Ornithinimicrobium sp.]HKJ10820.1 haloacid dehalogenase type II [Ornithinimicrobium sp.]